MAKRKRNRSSGRAAQDTPPRSRLDKFLKNVGIVSRREVAHLACQRGLIELDGRPAKPATEVRPKHELTVRLGMWVRSYRVLDVPPRPVPRAERHRWVQLLDEQRADANAELDLPSEGDWQD